MGNDVFYFRGSDGLLCTAQSQRSIAYTIHHTRDQVSRSTKTDQWEAAQYHGAFTQQERNNNTNYCIIIIVFVCKQ